MPIYGTLPAGIYDIGYGRDISGWTAALVSEVIKPGVTIEQIMQVCKSVDPLCL